MDDDTILERTDAPASLRTIIAPIRRVAGSPAAHRVLVLLVFWWAFALRFAHPDFLNDDFDLLAKGRQVVQGEWPDRDFYDDGRPLTIVASALAQKISPTLLSDLILRASGIAAGTAFVFILATEVTGTAILGLAAAFMTVAMHPRLYNYPKILLFPMGLWLLWRYVDRPGRGLAVQLAVMSVAAFLFRHDYGVYLALVIVPTFLLVDRAKALSSTAIYIACGLALGAPYLAWLSAERHLGTAGSKGASEMLRSAPGITWTRLRIVEIGPPKARIAIRWGSGVTDDRRRQLEDTFGLQERGVKTDGRTYLYAVPDESAEGLVRLVGMAEAEDTSGIDRNTGRLPPEPRWVRWQRRLHLVRVRTRDDAQAWIYYVFMASVPCALWILWRKRRIAIAPERARILSLLGLCVLLEQFLIQGNLDSRLPEVTPLAAVLLAWLTSHAMVHAARLGRQRSWGWAGAVVVGLIAVTLITWDEVAIYAEAPPRDVAFAGFIGPASIAHVVRHLKQRPIDVWDNASRTGTAAIARYVSACLGPMDRPFVVSFAPEVFYLSERLFPGGIDKFDGNGFNPSDKDVLRHLRGQSVPVVMIDEDFRSFLAKDWPLLTRYIQSRYSFAASTRFGESRRSWEVRVDSERPPSGQDTQWGLPCFRDPR